MENDKGTERVRDGGRGVLEKYFSVFTRCSRSVFLYIYGVSEGERHGGIVLSSVRCLRRELSTYSSPKGFWSRLYAFRSALFCLAVFYANYLYFQLFRKLFRRVLLIFSFLSGNRAQRA